MGAYLNNVFNDLTETEYSISGHRLLIISRQQYEKIDMDKFNLLLNLVRLKSLEMK